MGAYLATGEPASTVSCIFLFTCSGYMVFVVFDLATRPSLVLNDRLNISSKERMGSCSSCQVQNQRTSAGRKGKERQKNLGQ